ncbi:uncharacterized protein [Procambarus clarkii]
MSVTNPFTAAALRPQVSRINMPGRSTPASILAEGLQTLAILAKENLHREYFKINSALQKKCEYMKRSLNIEDLNYLKPSNKKGKGENYCRIIEINQTQRSNLSEALLPASLSPPHIQSSDFSTSVPTYTQTYLPAAEQTPKSLNSEPVVPAHPPNSCPNCSESKFTTLSSNNLCIFVTLSEGSETHIILVVSSLVTKKFKITFPLFRTLKLN